MNKEDINKRLQALLADLPDGVAIERYDIHQHTIELFITWNEPGRFEKIEGIATQRFTDYGKKLLCIEVEGNEGLSVDTPKDLDYVREIIAKKLDDGELSYFTELIKAGK